MRDAANRDRDRVMRLLDQETSGKSQLTIADYRRALYAVLAIEPSPPLISPNGSIEMMGVHVAGQRAALDRVIIALSAALGESRV